MKVFTWPRQKAQVLRLFDRGSTVAPAVVHAVDQIVSAVRRQGDVAVARYTLKFDKAKLRPGRFEVKPEALEKAWEDTPPKLRAALRLAKRRIEAFHRRQKLRGWTMRDPKLGAMEWRVEALERVGVYAPGFKAAYPSTVLMDVVPAKIAGVDEIILATPPGPDGMPDARTLAAAYLAGADRVFRMGGAQAVAAMAFGTRSVPRVDKIVGPGNIYVATAKQKLFGQVDIESIAGPTEVMILADGSARLEFVAADMLAQAEHDEAASAGAILIRGSARRARELEEEVARQLVGLERRRVASASIRRNGYIIRVPSEKAAAEIANLKAPEHVEIHTRSPRRLAARIRHAGAIFLGADTPEPVGDYIAGPNHTLPTGGSARFFSPLSVWSFYKTYHTIEATAAGLARHADAIQTLAEAEGLTAHARAVRIRMET